MDGIHDLGGKSGHGPVAPFDDDQTFPHAWEARAFGMFYAVHQPLDWNGDWFRFCRELIAPADYLTRPYYDQWVQSLTAMMVASGKITLSEAVSGKSNRAPLKQYALQSAQDVQTLKYQSQKFDLETAERPSKFEAGATVVAKMQATDWHTRMPQYIRGQTGKVLKVQGYHTLPDAKSKGVGHAEYLYLVAFRSKDIWPETNGANDAVHLDLWESYLE
jgi:nitrile hydratase subunit beta